MANVKVYPFFFVVLWNHITQRSPFGFQVIDETLKDGADKNTKDALTRVIVSRADVDMKDIKAAYQKQYGAQLEDVIAKNTLGNYRDALLALVGQ